MSADKPKPKPSTLGQQIKDAKKEWAKLSPEQRASVKLEGSSEATRGSVGRKNPL